MTTKARHLIYSWTKIAIASATTCNPMSLLMALLEILETHIDNRL
jgi:hypothetical protein